MRTPREVASQTGHWAREERPRGNRSRREPWASGVAATAVKEAGHEAHVGRLDGPLGDEIQLNFVARQIVEGPSRSRLRHVRPECASERGATDVRVGSRAEVPCDIGRHVSDRRHRGPQLFGGATELGRPLDLYVLPDGSMAATALLPDRSFVEVASTTAAIGTLPLARSGRFEMQRRNDNRVRIRVQRRPHRMLRLV